MVPRDANDADKMSGCFEVMGDAQLCFVGHSHVPGVYPESGGYRSPEAVGGSYEIGEERALINIGSVGQPRDGDTRATFATLNGSTVGFHRVEYDFRVTQKKIRAISELPDYLAERLEKGR